MKKRKKVLLIIPYINQFIQKDIDFLESEFSLTISNQNWKIKPLVPLFLIYQLFLMIIKVPSTDKVLIQFGGFWSLLPSIIGRIFKKPVAIILHGTDCASIPNLNYGSLRKKLLKRICQISYKKASILLPVSDSLIQSKNEYNSSYSNQGIKYHFPNLNTPFLVIPNGLDETFWNCESSSTKDKNKCIAVFSKSQFYLKGGDLIIELAKHFPEIKFQIVGIEDKHNLPSAPDNVAFSGRLNHIELRKAYQEAQFHFQLSLFEGFGLSLCEAMLCECIPIGSSVNMIPQIIGDTGFILNQKKIDLLIDIMQKAIATTNKEDLGKKARQRIVENFNESIRRELLINCVNNMH